MASQRRTPRSSPASRRPGGAARPAGRSASGRRPRSQAGAEHTQPDRQPQGGGSGGSRLTGRAAVLFLVLLVLLISYASSLRAWLQQRDDTAQARADVAEAQQGIADLEEERERLRDPAYIEQLARESFGWVMPGETGYTALDEEGDALDGQNDLTEPEGSDETDDEEWYAKVWGSVQSAGEEQEADDESTGQPERPRKNRVVRPEEPVQ